MSMRHTRLLPVLCVFTLSLPAMAAPPATVQLEGVMRAAGGTPVADGDYAVTFSLYAGEKDAKAAWAEADVNLKVVGGRFGHALGSVTPLTSDLLAAIQPGWLGLKVGADPELNRQPLHAVPWALRAVSAASVACSGCLAGEAIKAGAISADKVGFTYAGAKTKGGPADVALDLQCTGCVSVAELKFDKDVDLGGNGLKAKALTADQVAAQTVSAVSFVGDGSKLTGIKVPAGTCNKGELVSGIAADGKLICAAPDSAKLNADGLDEVSGGLLTNEFVYVWASANVPVDIPDNNPTGVGDELIVGDQGLAKGLSVQIELNNSELADVEVLLFDPNNIKYVLIAKGAAKGKSIKTAFPTPTKPAEGDLSAWIGKNPKGKWRIKVADHKFLNNGKDGAITAWSVSVDVLSNQKVEATKDLHVKGDLTVDGALIAQGVFRYPVGDKPPVKCEAATVGYAWVHTKDEALMICNGKDWGVINLGIWGTQDKPAASCADLLKKAPTSKTGDFWIKPAGAAAPFKAYCDMDLEGGGWTFYPISSGISTSSSTANNSCKALGMDIVYPRSKAHWDVLLKKYGASYFATIPGVTKPANGGNYTNCIMRSPKHYGSGCADWRVGDGGRWWLRDGTYSEPNGDYTANCWLSMYKHDINDIRFNDGGCSYATSKYICSTNDKP